MLSQLTRKTKTSVSLHTMATGGQLAAGSCLLKMKLCPACTDHMIYVNNAHKARERKLAKPAHIKAPVSKTDPHRIKLTLQGQRLRCAELERELNEMRTELKKSSIEMTLLVFLTVQAPK